MPIDPDSLDAFKALALGFAFAGLLATAFEALAKRPASFKLLQTGDAVALATVPLVVFSAPFIIIRNTVRGRRYERRTIPAVMAATVLAGLWSIPCGRLVLDIAAVLAGA